MRDPKERFQDILEAIDNIKGGRGVKPSILDDKDLETIRDGEDGVRELEFEW